MNKGGVRSRDAAVSLNDSLALCLVRGGVEWFMYRVERAFDAYLVKLLLFQLQDEFYEYNDEVQWRISYYSLSFLNKSIGLLDSTHFVNNLTRMKLIYWFFNIYDCRYFQFTP